MDSEQHEYTVSDLVAVATELGSRLSKLDRLLALALLNDGEEAETGEYWVDRYWAVKASTDDSLLGQLLARGYHALEHQTLPPLLFDGAPADLTDFKHAKPGRIACGDFEMACPNNAQAIVAMERDPSMGIVFVFALMEQASGWERERLLDLPHGVFCQLEEGCAFLYRDFVMQTIALSA